MSSNTSNLESIKTLPCSVSLAILTFQKFKCQLINYNPDLIQRKIGVPESFEIKCTSDSFYKNQGFITF
jgi:hypothetical protein